MTERTIIIGAATAWHLAKRGVAVMVLEESSVADIADASQHHTFQYWRRAAHRASARKPVYPHVAASARASISC